MVWFVWVGGAGGLTCDFLAVFEGCFVEIYFGGVPEIANAEVADDTAVRGGVEAMWAPAPTHVA